MSKCASFFLHLENASTNIIFDDLLSMKDTETTSRIRWFDQSRQSLFSLFGQNDLHGDVSTSHGDKQFAAHLVIHFLKIDFSQHDTGCTLPFESIHRFGNEIRCGPDRVTTAVKIPCESFQVITPQTLIRQNRADDFKPCQLNATMPIRAIPLLTSESTADSVSQRL